MDKRLKMPDEIVQLRANWQLPNGDMGANILYMLKQDFVTGGNVAYNDTDADTSANHLAQAFHVLQGYLSTQVTLAGVDWCWNEAVNTGPLHLGTNVAAPMPFAGTNAAQALPTGISLAVRFQTGLGGRGNHGRMFFVGLNDGFRDGTNPDKVKPAEFASLATDLGAWEAAFNWNNVVLGIGNDFNHCVVSFILGGALRATASHHKVSAVNMSDAWLDYQRRRAPAHARHD